MGHDVDAIGREVVDAAVKLHMRIGPGLLESVYEVLLAKELQLRGLRVERQRAVHVRLDGITFEEAFRLDLLVDDSVVVEIKSVRKLAPAHWKQVLTYLRLMDLRLGFLINFGGATLKGQIKRVANSYLPLASSRLGVKRSEQLPVPASAHAPGSMRRMT